VWAYKGSVEDTVFQLLGGLRSGMGYCGAPTIEALKQNGQFVKISAASLKESHPHDIHITKEAPNYSVDAPKDERLEEDLPSQWSPKTGRSSNTYL